MFKGVEAGKKAAGDVLALQKRVLSILNEARCVTSRWVLTSALTFYQEIFEIHTWQVIVFIRID